MSETSSPEDSLKRVVVGRYGVLYKSTSSTNTPTKLTEVDLRSDTVTKPTEEMRVAMFEAEVGDDVYQDDPTVVKLQKRVAEITGMEAALYVPSGTMGNLICVLTHCSARGEEALIGEWSHISIFEQGGMAQFGGVHSRTVKNLPDGTLDLDDLQKKIMPNDVHMTCTKLVCVENSQNLMGGRVIRPEYMDKVKEIIKDKGIKLHVDGARIFNAATALHLPVKDLLKHADSVSMCLSKGLGAPVGSVIAGNKEFIERAHRLRKALGGGMRQVGVLAAPGLIALDKMSQNLQPDHDNAKRLAEGLDEMKHLGMQVDVSAVETNIVNFSLAGEGMTANDFVEKLETSINGDEDSFMEVKVRLLASSRVAMRAVIHHQVSREGVEVTLKKMRKILENN